MYIILRKGCMGRTATMGVCETVKIAKKMVKLFIKEADIKGWNNDYYYEKIEKFV